LQPFDPTARSADSVPFCSFDREICGDDRASEVLVLRDSAQDGAVEHVLATLLAVVPDQHHPPQGVVT
jgi:hypothetical protein